MRKIQLKTGLKLSKETLSRLQENQTTKLKGGKRTTVITLGGQGNAKTMGYSCGRICY